MGNIFVPRGQAQGIRRDIHLHLQIVCIGRFNYGFKLCLLGGQCIKIGVRLGVGRIHFIKAALSCLDFVHGLLNHFFDGFRRVQLWFLLQVTYLDAGHWARLTFDLLVKPSHNLQQG